MSIYTPLRDVRKIKHLNSEEGVKTYHLISNKFIFIMHGALSYERIVKMPLCVKMHFTLFSYRLRNVITTTASSAISTE
jgi:hypothetical protein